MKKSEFNKIDYLIKNDLKFSDASKTFKTTNINILLNRVKLEKKNKSKKKIIFIISLISILSFFSIIVLSD